MIPIDFWILSSDEGSWLKAHLHSPGSADNEDDSGVAQDSHEGDGAIEYREQHNNAGLEMVVCRILCFL